MARPPPWPTLFPYTTLFRSRLLKVIALPAARQESTCLTRLFKAVPAGAVMLGDRGLAGFADRQSTRLNSSHVEISYAVLCLKKKKRQNVVLASSHPIGALRV